MSRRGRGRSSQCRPASICCLYDQVGVGLLGVLVGGLLVPVVEVSSGFELSGGAKQTVSAAVVVAGTPHSHEQRRLEFNTQPTTSHQSILPPPLPPL
jgi:hypothetical protein